jgi:hypothetical protein
MISLGDSTATTPRNADRGWPLVCRREALHADAARGWPASVADGPTRGADPDRAIPAGPLLGLETSQRPRSLAALAQPAWTFYPGPFLLARHRNSVARSPPATRTADGCATLANLDPSTADPPSRSRLR